MCFNVRSRATTQFQNTFNKKNRHIVIRFICLEEPIRRHSFQVLSHSLTVTVLLEAIASEVNGLLHCNNVRIGI